MKAGNALLFVFVGMLAISCNNNTNDVDVSGIQVDATIHRFEQDLFKSFEATSSIPVMTLRKQYGEFFDVFAHRIISIPEGPDTMLASNLKMFVTDAEVKDVFRQTDSAFKNVDEIRDGMQDFLKRLSFHYPDKPVPGIVTYISAFNYAVITTDSVIGIGLDMFLGPENVYYPRLGIPKYMFSRFRKEYIVPSAIKAWFQSEYDGSNVKNEFLSQMIYQGKQLYFMKSMAPGMEDTLLTGYTASQLEWCKQNEASIWSFFIENKLLFNTDPSLFAKFINEGPSTSGFPGEAPGKIGAWIGWQIVNDYASQNKELQLHTLMQEQDAQKILEQSGYKPQK